MYSDKDQEMRDWAQKFEAGVTDDPTLVLANQLREARPPQINPPAGFQADLRRQLLTRNGKSAETSWQPIWRFAASGALVALLGVAVFVMWNGLSNSAEIVQGVNNSGGVANLDIESAELVGSRPNFIAMNVPLADEIELVGVERPAPHANGDYYTPGDKLGVRISLRAKSAPRNNYNAVVQLFDASGALVASDEIPENALQPMQTWGAGETIESAYELALPEGLPAGTYSLVVGLLDEVTGAVVALSGGNAVAVADVMVIDSRRAAAIAAAVDEMNEAGAVGQAQSVVWLNGVRQFARASAEDPLRYQLIMNYNLGPDVETASLLVQLARPDWQSVPDGPVMTVREGIDLAESGDALTFSFTIDPQKVAETLDSAEAVLLLSVVEDGNQLLSSAAASLPAGLFVLDDSVQLISAAAGATALGRAQVLSVDLSQASESGLVTVPVLYELDGAASADLVVSAETADGTLELARRSVPAGRGFYRFAILLPESAIADLENIRFVAGYHTTGVGTPLTGDESVQPIMTVEGEAAGAALAATPTPTEAPEQGEADAPKKPAATATPTQPAPTTTPVNGGGGSDGTIPTRTPTP